MIAILPFCNNNKETNHDKKQCAKAFQETTHPVALSFNDIQLLDGRLKTRIMANFDRLERGRYLPDSIYIVPNAEYHQTKWPGDVPGRLVLGTSVLAQLTNRSPKYLNQIVHDFPNHTNRKGYFGAIYPDKINEQQLSGHGWLLRGLCQYYTYSNDTAARAMLQTVVDSLVMPTKGFHSSYPIDPETREHAGNFMGDNAKTMGKWILSTDVGCDFIFLDGVVHAYQILQDEELKPVIDEMIARFLEADIVEIKAQTHATLTGLRALLRYYKITEDTALLYAVEKRYNRYKKEAMTENYENYNWFGRPRWTEPCAVVDSYIVALGLWQFTGKTEYLFDAQLIYYNGIGSEQRANGGFGCNSCLGTYDPLIPDKKGNEPFLRIKTEESHWCCTMRGAEGLASVAQNSVFKHNGRIIFTDYHNISAKIAFADKTIGLGVKTDYPGQGDAEVNITENNISFTPEFCFIAPPWTEKHELLLNGKPVEFALKNGFITSKLSVQKGDKINLRFSLKTYIQDIQNHNNIADYYAFYYGALLLGIDTDKEIFIDRNTKLLKQNEKMYFATGNDSILLRPVNHLLDKRFTGDFKMQALFTNEKTNNR